MRVRNLASLVSLSLALAAAPALAQQDIDKVFGGITAEAGKEYRNLESVNGGITIREGATVRSAETVNGGITVQARARLGSTETVNGGITIGADAEVGSAETVNGGIRLAAGAQVSDDVETVNGGIQAARGARIGGDATTVNGGIALTGARVGGDLKTVHGDITLAAGSQVDGGILVEKPTAGWFNSNKRVPRVVIGADAVVAGSLVFEHDVELFVHPTAKIGPVTGATAQAFTDTLPPRD